MWSIPKWMIDPMGPLSIRPAHIPHLMSWLLSYLGHSHKKNVAHIAKALHAINCRVSEDYGPMLAKIGYADKVRDKGCIRVYDNYESFKLSAQEWAIHKQLGSMNSWVKKICVLWSPL